MRFLLGLVIGIACGAGGMYLAWQRPWASDEAVDALDAGTSVAEEDGKSRTRKRHKGKRRRGPGDVEIAIEGDIPTLTDADRRLVWRGDTVALPPKQVDFAGAGETRPLAADEINQVVSSQSGDMLSCITSARGNAELDAEIMVKMLVDGSGNVVKVRVRAPAYLFANDFYPCARRAARSMRFPATGAHTVVDAPYNLY